MLRQRLIPSLLLRSGRLVKGVRYADWKDAGLPHTTARAYNAQGADEIVIIDIDATRENRLPDIDVIAKVAAESMVPLTVGGGINSIDVARAVMGAGADKLLLTAAALDNPILIDKLANIFGSQAVVLGLDVWRDNENAAWQVWDYRNRAPVVSIAPGVWARQAVALGVGEIRLMAAHREGTRTGCDIDLLAAVRHEVNVPLILEGGVGDLEHIDAAFAAGANGVALGTLLVFADNNLVKIKKFLENRARNIRKS